MPVAGLLGQAGSVLREQDYAALETIAGEPSGTLLSADIFFATATPVPVAVRAALLEGLGLFGLRLAVALIQQGLVHDAGQLARELRRRSGLDELRDLLLDLFTERSDALKAQVGMQLLDRIVQEHPVPGSDLLRRRIEALAVGAHELTELRLLNDLRSGAVDLHDPELLERAEALLGARGSSVSKRLRLSDDVSTGDLRSAVMDTLHYWQRIASSPVSTPATRRTAAILCRTVEGMLLTPNAAGSR